MTAPRQRSIRIGRPAGERGYAWRCLRALQGPLPAEVSELACCFERVDAPVPSAWIGTGRLATIACDVYDGKIVARLSAGDRLLWSQVSPLLGAELSYTKLFSALRSALREGRSSLPGLHPSWSAEDARDLQWFGGWKYAPRGRAVPRAACFHLPRLAVHVEAGSVRAFNWGGLPSGLVEDAARRAAAARPERQREKLSLVCDREIPCRAAYLDAARRVLDAISTRKCDKIVLSRKRVLEFSRPLDRLDVYSRLIGHGGHAFQYLMSLGDGETWVGISPELLLRRRGLEIETRPLAGSRRRGSSAEEDEHERERLLRSEKDGREHDLARDHMIRRLGRVCEDDSLLAARVKEVARLSYIQHLATEIKGRLRPAYDTADALACIYPPATILGVPELSAERTLRACEPFERGFFTGGVGVLSSSGDCDVALCIRSAEIRGRELHVYAGSGYVEGSSPEDEWRETEAKMAPFLDLASPLLQHAA